MTSNALKIVIEDANGMVTRQIPVTEKSGILVHRFDSKRLHVVKNTDFLELQKIQFSELAKLDFEHLQSAPMNLGSYGTLRVVDSISGVALDAKSDLSTANAENRRTLSLAIAVAIGLFFLLLAVVVWAPQENTKVNDELKEQVVKIVKLKAAKTVIPKSMSVAANEKTSTAQPVVKTKNTEMLKRAGALSVLGSLKSGQNKGGLNLAAANTTAGPGLGGTAGSGGVQKSLYATGITSAPLGAGHNISGAGGYGTKGKGGGQAGYGSLSLAGSAGGAPVPLGAEAEIASGLDRSQIDEVIRRNLGQVRFCYEQGLQKNASLSGRVVVGFTVAATGAISSAQIESTSIADKAVEECISMRLKTWKFPTPQGGVSVKVSYPFVLRRQGQG